MFIKEFFYLNRNDRRVVYVLAAVAIVAVLVAVGLGGGGNTAPLTAADSISAAKIGGGAKPYGRDYVGGYAVEERKVERFSFDPNTADSTQLLRLGLSPWQVRNIYKYRARGGKYLKPTDFARLPGLTVGEYRALEPYIKISDDYLPAASVVGAEPAEFQRDTARYTPKMRQGEHLALNAADTTALKRVPGVGSYFARKIVTFRERLGGFVRTSQLLEIEQFPQQALPYFEVDASSVRKLNVNRLALSQLRSHPYLNFYQARAIVDFRRLRGNLGGMSDLRNMKEFSEADLKRLEPYLDF